MSTQNSDYLQFLSENELKELDTLLDYESIPVDGIQLSPAQVDTAFANSQRIREPEKRWAVYLSGLALAGFEQWLQSHTATDIVLDRSRASILEPAALHAVTAVDHLYANQFRLCLVATPSLPDDRIAMPKNVIDAAIADFYIPVAIDEEIQQVQIERFLSRSSLLQHQAEEPLRVNREGLYEVPIGWFDPDCDRLLLTLSCTQPEAISSFQAVPSTSSTSQIVSSPDLATPVINLGRWFQQQVDDLVQDLTWTLFPTWEIAGAMRGETPFRDTDSEGFLAILKTLAQQGTQFPPDLRVAYETLQLNDHTLQLCIVVAPLVSPNNPQGWSLMAILKPQEDGYLPNGIRLQIADQGTMLIEQGTQLHRRAGSLYVRAVGEQHEILTVTIFQTDPQGNEQQIKQFPFRFEEV